MTHRADISCHSRTVLRETVAPHLTSKTLAETISEMRDTISTINAMGNLPDDLAPYLAVARDSTLDTRARAEGFWSLVMDGQGKGNNLFTWLELTLMGFFDIDGESREEYEERTGDRVSAEAPAETPEPTPSPRSALDELGARRITVKIPGKEGGERILTEEENALWMTAWDDGWYRREKTYAPGTLEAEAYYWGHLDRSLG